MDERESLPVFLRLYGSVNVAVAQLRREISLAAEAESLSELELLTILVCSCENTTGVVQRRLAELVGVSPARMSGLVEQLRRQDLLTRHPCRQDRRRTLWTITETAKPITDRVNEQLTARTQIWTATISLPSCDQPDADSERSLNFASEYGTSSSPRTGRRAS